MNVGLTAAQLRQLADVLADVLADRGQPEPAGRVRAALERQLRTSSAR